MLSLCSSWVTHLAWVNPSIWSTEWLELLPHPPEWDASPCQGYPLHLHHFIKLSWQLAMVSAPFHSGVTRFTFPLDAWNYLIIFFCFFVLFVSRYQQLLHRNLVYLATLADSTQSMQNTIPVCESLVKWLNWAALEFKNFESLWILLNTKIFPPKKSCKLYGPKNVSTFSQMKNI